MLNNQSVGIKVAQQGAHLARQALLVGGLYMAMGRFPGNTKLVTAVGLGGIGAIGFARHRLRWSKYQGCQFNVREGLIFGAFDLAQHGIDLLCVYQVAKLVQNRAGASSLKQGLVFGGTAVWGACRAFAMAFHWQDIDSFYQDIPVTVIPLGLCCSDDD